MGLSGETDLQRLLAGLAPKLDPRPYAFQPPATLGGSRTVPEA